MWIGETHCLAISQTETTPNRSAIAMARRLAREEGLFAGESSGANIVASLRVGERLGPDATIVTIPCDSRLRYLSNDLYARPNSGIPEGRRQPTDIPSASLATSCTSPGRPLLFRTPPISVSTTLSVRLLRASANGTGSA